MKNYILIAISSFFLAACSGGNASDKQAQLDSLLKEQAEINDKISKLKSAISEESGDKSGIKLVAAEVITPEIFKHFVEVQAKVDGDENINVSPRSQGIVTSIIVKEGDKVTKGQTLATLDDQIARQSLAEVETQYNFAKNIYEKQKNLWDQNIGSEVQYLTAKNNKESLEKRLASVNEQLDLTRIKSPVNGTVDYIAIKVGQAVMPGMPAITVVNLTGLKVIGEVGEAYAGRINKGDEVILYFPDMKKEIVSKVAFAARNINPLNRTFNVEVALNSQENYFSPNMIAVMKIVDYKKDDAMVIPVDLLQQSGEGYYLMTAVEKTGKLYATRRVVETGKIYNGQAEILSGLKTSDKVITNGYRDLNEGQEIRLK